MNSRFIGESEAYVKRISQELINNIGSPVPFIKEIGSHILLGNGKLLRPLLFILSCKLLNYEREHIYPLCTVFEYIHVASLLHDDVLDNAEMRRNRPSVNNKWGDHVAILEGDFLYSRALTTALQTGSFRFLERVTRATNNMVEGQLMEIAHTSNLEITRQEYMSIIEKKTAALLSAACGCAAVLADAKDRIETALSDFGHYLGIAFQLVDDLLDYTSSEDIFGKPVGKDLREGKVTLPLIYALQEMEKMDRKKVRHLLEGKDISDSEYSYIIEKVAETNAISHTKEEAFFYIKKAHDALSCFENSPAKITLIELGNYIVHRNR